MKQRRQPSIDGFVPSSNRQAGGGFSGHRQKPEIPGQFLQRPTGTDRPVINADTLPKPHIEAARKTVPTISRSELSESLHQFDDATPEPRSRLKKRHKGAASGRRSFGFSKRKMFAVVGIIVLLAGAYFGIKLFMTSSQLFSGNLFDLLGSGARLKADQYGRTNILVFGTSEDDPSHEDAGAHLTDSIMIISVDQEKKNAVMVSVPRDLWVKYGKACMSGYEGKINVVYECGSDDGSDEKAGAKALMDMVGDSFGLDIQYYAHVNYTVVRDTVNAVGGVTVEIDSDDPRGVLDRNFDWACNYKCYYVKWPNGPARLNGDQALALARARNAAGGYGLGGGNFDREQYQQKIIMALKDKAASAGTLANPLAVSGILDALGSNVRTSFSASEVKTLIRLAGELPTANIKRVSLVEDTKAVLTTGNMAGQSMVRPVKGVYDFSEVQRFVRTKLSASSSPDAEVSVEVLNGSDYKGLAGKKAAELEAAGFGDVATGDTPTNAAYGDYVWYDVSGGKYPETTKKLQTILGSAPTGTVLPSGIQSSADFVIIVGNGAR